MKKSYKYLSKGRILTALEDELDIFKIPKSLVFEVSDWKKNKINILNKINYFFLKKHHCHKLAIRSSALNEDKDNKSNAGVYDSYLDVDTNDEKKIIISINNIIRGYIKNKINSGKSEIIIQQMIQNTYLSGVIFTHNLNNGSPYYVINYDDVSGLTNTVTSGSSKYSNRSLYVYRDKISEIKSPRFRKIIIAVKDLEKKVGNNYLDIEFTCDKNLNIYLLQVRQIAKPKPWSNKLKKNFSKTIRKTGSKLNKLFKKRKDLSGNTNIFGQMPDWNPAEMIGKTPRALSFSLYEKLITNHIWADARELMGYKKIHFKKLMQSFAGQPYIDVRLSLNSFLPNNLPKKISNKLINHWLEKLKNNPKLHDKIEFELAITCFSFDLDQRMSSLVGDVLNKNEKIIYAKYLKKLTLNCLNETSKFSLPNTLKNVEKLKQKQRNFKIDQDVKNLRTYLNDCKTYGVLPFSILARHAFISTTIINSLKILNILSDKQTQNFLKSIKTITSEMITELEISKTDKKRRKKFLKKYGHLRPGTYDIMSKRYDEKNYFNFDEKLNSKILKHQFKFNNKQKRKIQKLLKKYFNNMDFDSFINYLKTAIALREYSKFIFTKSVSHILAIISKFSRSNNLNDKMSSNIPINYFLKDRIKKKELINIFKKNNDFHEITNSLKLPQIIHEDTSPYIAPFQINIPNFITSKKIEGKTKNITNNTINEKLDNKIVLIEGADPGYDWIFSHKIKGLVTKFGGANSHMAIRSSEFEIPAAIGCGENIFNELSSHEFVILNCEDKLIKPIKFLT